MLVDRFLGFSLQGERALAAAPSGLGDVAFAVPAFVPRDPDDLARGVAAFDWNLAALGIAWTGAERRFEPTQNRSAPGKRATAWKAAECARRE
jgi:hypothetical protein